MRSDLIWLLLLMVGITVLTCALSQPPPSPVAPSRQGRTLDRATASSSATPAPVPAPASSPDMIEMKDPWPAPNCFQPAPFYQEPPLAIRLKGEVLFEWQQRSTHLLVSRRLRSSASVRTLAKSQARIKGTELTLLMLPDSLASWDQRRLTLENGEFRADSFLPALVETPAGQLFLGRQTSAEIAITGQSLTVHCLEGVLELPDQGVLIQGERAELRLASE